MARKKSQASVSQPSGNEGELHRTKLRVIGIGGGGSNIVAELSHRLKRGDFFVANTDVQALKAIGKGPKVFAFGQGVTAGLGCGMDPRVGERAAREDAARISKLFEGQDLVLLVSSLGGGSGSGGAPVFAELGRTSKCLTLGIFTLPFSFEGEKRKQIADASLERLKNFLNAYVVIPNDAIFKIVPENIPLKAAFSAVNKRLTENLEGFLETLFLPGLINVDFADVKAVLEGGEKLAYLSTSTVSGAGRSSQAAEAVLADPLYGYRSGGAARILFNIAGGKDLRMSEVGEISSIVGAQNPKAKIIFGLSTNPKLNHKLRVMVCAVGCDQEPEKRNPPKAQKVFRRARQTRRNLKDAGGLEEKPKQEKKRVLLKRKPRRKPKKKAPPRQEHKTQEVSQDAQRRNALDVKKAIDEAIENLQQKEQQWDTPAFLRFKWTR
ncbi:MAG: hypothetical protein HYS52_01155 [Candidatus Wildermuthbacteria bacterium]|nr:hypothetical protein [Candidatus Wildermuthbacteria bacterium]